ncbi:hypothetical protein BDN72DRAFT_131657 [Pluteus cervinus]|uniref:Uncharacterized protein n=1 Tax=Pluteus cervinus TaxID=181527 RepID=A0ACD3ALT9_9AGAR|nr:hypothetical protein BDN72DRAFT_131657 [Pluteus cervinus]
MSSSTSMACTHPILTQHFDTSDIVLEEVTGLRENTFTPIYRLPPEILSRIFSFAQHVPKRQSEEYRNSTYLKWLVVTGVSQHWRDVALESPGLWSHISMSYSTHVIEEWLRRSKAAPLSVITHEGPSSPQEAHLITTSLFRIRELELAVNTTLWNSLWSNLSSPAPLLESLRVTIPYNLYRSRPFPIISDSTFAGMTPRLRRLELIGCSVDINSSILRNLTDLELSDLFQEIPATDILTAVRRLPGLTSLTLSHCVLSNNAPVSSNLGAISLPYLKSLVIRGRSFVRDLDILSHLSFPKSATLLFSSCTPTQGAAALSDFFGINHAARSQGSSPSLQSNVCLQLWPSVFMLQIYAECAEPAHVTKFLDLELSGHWEHALEPSNNPQVTALFSSSPLSSITSFRTSCLLNVETWTNIFGSLPHLKHILAAGSRAVNLLSALVDDIKGKIQSGDEDRQISSTSSQLMGYVPIFPRLEMIELEAMIFAKNLSPLFDTLRARKSAGMGIKTIEIRVCRNMNQRTYESLRDLVDDVVWDGVMHGGVISDTDSDA